MTNSIYLGISLDGYIAGPNGELDWLETVPAPEGDDLGFGEFMAGIDALVMGRNTYETVLGFGEWPYEKPVFVLSRSLTELAPLAKDKAEILHGEPAEIVAALHARGFENLYLDGGITARSFLAADLVDELILTTIPILIGGGIPLFDELPEQLVFELVQSEVLAGQLAKLHYRRKRG